MDWSLKPVRNCASDKYTSELLTPLFPVLVVYGEVTGHWKFLNRRFVALAPFFGTDHHS
jgi:hypothetical protein